MFDDKCRVDGCPRPVQLAKWQTCRSCFTIWQRQHETAGLPIPSPSAPITITPRPLRPGERAAVLPGPGWVPGGVDTQTEVLTERGWCHHSVLRMSDRVYSLDIDLHTARFEPLEDVHLRSNQKQTVRNIETGGFSMIATLDHPWPIRVHTGVWKRSEPPGYETQVRISGKLTSKNGIYRSIPDVMSPDEGEYSDSFVELIAWIWTEGCIYRHKNAVRCNIVQSDVVNPHKCERIRVALEGSFPGQWRETLHKPSGCQFFSLRKSATDVVREVCGQDKAPISDFILAMTEKQLRLFIDTCLAGDGHVEKDGEGTARWMQRSMHSIRTFEMICALAGAPTSTKFKKSYPSHYGRDMHTVTLLRRQVVVPLAGIAEKYSGRGNKSYHRLDTFDQQVLHHGQVWSPITASGTWLARRNGTVYFTGSPNLN